MGHADKGDRMVLIKRHFHKTLKGCLKVRMFGEAYKQIEIAKRLN